MNQNGELNSMSLLTTEQVIEIIKMTKKSNRKSDQKIADMFNVSRKTVTNIRKNKSWKHISRDIN